MGLPGILPLPWCGALTLIRVHGRRGGGFFVCYVGGLGDLLGDDFGVLGGVLFVGWCLVENRHTPCVEWLS